MADPNANDDRGSSKKEKKPEAGLGGPQRPSGGPSRGLLDQYKPDQGKWTRLGTIGGAGALIAWAGLFLMDNLARFEGSGISALLITKGIPILAAVVLFLVAYWVVYVGRKSSDFMIATEGEMKKVNWSSKREIIGSTKVVILFTVLMAILLFIADFIFQRFFVLIDVLKTE
jgi:preprotein translocase subunit SecE